MASWIQDSACTKIVTVEPILALYSLARGIGGPANSALWYRKVCFNEYPEYICQDLHNSTYEDEESWVQKKTSEWKLYESLFHSVPCMIFAIIYGSWSDRFSRKIPLIIPLIGTLVEEALYLVNAIYLGGPVWLMLPGLVVSGFCGGYTALLSSVFSYLTEVSSTKSRTVRISVVYSVNLVCNSVAHFVSGLIFDNTGFVCVYTIAILFLGLAVIYVAVFIKDYKPSAQNGKNKETKKEPADQVNGGVSSHDAEPTLDMNGAVSPVDPPKTVGELREETTGEAEPVEQPPTCCETAKRLFGVYHMTDAFKVVVEKRGPHLRMHLIVLLCVIFYMIAVSGECL